MTTAGWRKVQPKRRPEAVASLLKVLAAMLEAAQESDATSLRNQHVKDGSEKVCPIYPFD
ncbi:MAG TPA: hypothetical protein VK582_17585 [Pyrinomonadaceae bacterium]|nr:hypothetical protein [Pyrinomonadaceae bacterium]